MTRFTIVTLCVLAAIYIAFGLSWMEYMSSVDWGICFENIGTVETETHIAEMTFEQQWSAFQKEYIKNSFWPAFLILSPFLPLLLAMAVFDSMKQVWAILVMFIFIAFLSWPDLNGDPSFTHDCDRKGYQAVYPIFMPVFCIITSSVIFIMALLERKKLKKNLT